MKVLFSVVVIYRCHQDTKWYVKLSAFASFYYYYFLGCNFRENWLFLRNFYLLRISSTRVLLYVLTIVILSHSVSYSFRIARQKFQNMIVNYMPQWATLATKGLKLMWITIKYVPQLTLCSAKSPYINYTDWRGINAYECNKLKTNHLNSFFVP